KPGVFEGSVDRSVYNERDAPRNGTSSGKACWPGGACDADVPVARESAGRFFPRRVAPSRRAAAACQRQQHPEQASHHHALTTSGTTIVTRSADPWHVSAST